MNENDIKTVDEIEDEYGIHNANLRIGSNNDWYLIYGEDEDSIVISDFARNLSFIGLPVGPICNPSLESINAALNPSDTNFEYFYADINTGKVYFAEDIKGFYEIQKKLGEN